MRFGFIVTAVAGSFALAACALRNQSGIKYPPKKINTADRYLSPLIPIARRQEPRHPSETEKLYVVGGSYACDRPEGDEEKGRLCERRWETVKRRVREEIGKQFRCDERLSEGRVISQDQPIRRQEAVCEAGLQSPYSMNLVWREVIRRLFDPDRLSDRIVLGGLDLVERDLAGPLPDRSKAHAFYLLFRVDRPPNNPSAPGATYYLRRQELHGEVDRDLRYRKKKEKRFDLLQ
ncbi:MAG: hypothetical protein HYW02_05715 [Deltaproteobacteria bacterium]|nr:hypothetical protein [Deltaproteobacteria bacterium]MBI2500952.1 hypothetical protein [Deltaproteobacteria bacterium]